MLQGLLGTDEGGFGSPQSAAIYGLLAGYQQTGGLLGALAAGGAAGQAARQDALKQKYMQAQMENIASETELRRQEAAAKKAALEREIAIQKTVPSLFKPAGLTGGDYQPQSVGGIPLFSLPPTTTPVKATPGGFDVERALALGMKPDDIQKYAGLENIGVPEVARTVNVPGPNGEKMLQQLDKFGRPVGKPLTEFEVAQMVNLGDKQIATIPRPGQSFTMGQTPDSKASNAVAWANNAATLRGQNLTDARARENMQFQREQMETGKIPTGYRAKPGGGLEFIPGGPADPDAAKRAAPTEFQGKSAMFGTRAQEADKIISALDGKYSPSALQTKEKLGNVWVAGPALEGAANAMLSDSAQKAEQAQRDFINAVLRLESGAAIGKDEFESAKRQYFPQPFDSAAVKEQKAQNRKLAVQGLLGNARPGSPANPPKNTGSVSGSFESSDPLGLRR